jgi:hypothetical protein
MTVTELKAQAYDYLAQIEFLQKKLQETNKALQDKLNEQSSPVTELEIVKD